MNVAPNDSAAAAAEPFVPLAERLRAHAAARPGDLALIGDADADAWTWARLDAHVDRLAATLDDSGAARLLLHNVGQLSLKLMRVQLDGDVPTFSAIPTSREFHEHEDHQLFSGNHFSKKDIEVA